MDQLNSSLLRSLMPRLSTLVGSVSIPVFLLGCQGDGTSTDYFDGDLTLRPLGDGKMELLAPFAYVDRVGERWEAQQSYVTDGASIPQAFWSVVGSPFTGDYLQAAVIHDWYCSHKTKPWQDVHRTFYHACLRGGVGEIQASVLYAAVYHFGPRWTTNQPGEPDAYSPQLADALSRAVGDDPSAMGKIEYNARDRMLTLSGLESRRRVVDQAASASRKDFFRLLADASRGDEETRRWAMEFSTRQDVREPELERSMRRVEQTLERFNNPQLRGQFQQFERARSARVELDELHGSLERAQEQLFKEVKRFVETGAPSLKEIEAYEFEPNP